MGEARRRKNLDPNYGKPKKDNFFNDYSLRFKKLNYSFKIHGISTRQDINLKFEMPKDCSSMLFSVCEIEGVLFINDKNFSQIVFFPRHDDDIIFLEQHGLHTADFVNCLIEFISKIISKEKPIPFSL